MNVHVQDTNGSEWELEVTSPDPADGTYCAHMSDAVWIRIVPTTNPWNSKKTLLETVTSLEEDDKGIAQIENLHEADYGMLQDIYGLEENEAIHLERIISEQTRAGHNTYDLKPNQAEAFLEIVQESIHQGFDGFDDYDRIVIRAFLADLCHGMSIK